MKPDFSRRKILAASIGLALGLTLLVWAGLTYLKDSHSEHNHSEASNSEGGSIEIGVGSHLPNFEFQTLDAKSVKISDVSGKITLINFWATWCESCLVEMPSIQKLYNRFHEEGLQVVAISLDEASTFEEVPPLVNKLNITFPVYADPSQKVSDLLSISAIPITLIVDSDRKILFIENGEKDWFSDDTQKLVESWLSSTPGG